MIEQSLVDQQEAHDVEIQALTERIDSLEGSNRALGKAIGLLHKLNEQEPGTSKTNEPNDS